LETSKDPSSQIFITLKGAIYYRSKYCWKEYDKVKSIERNYEIEKKELCLKTHCSGSNYGNIFSVER